MHGLSDHPLYTVWRSMKRRCYNPKHTKYDRYGGRGIKVCSSWLDSFITFYTAVVDGYKEGLELDRINNDGNYEPDNVRWVTRQQNLMNTSSRKGTTSKHKGVFWEKSRAKWCVKIKSGNERRQVGRFDSEEDAALAYNEAAKELFGEYANLNKIETN